MPDFKSPSLLIQQKRFVAVLAVRPPRCTEVRPRSPRVPQTGWSIALAEVLGKGGRVVSDVE